jgi:hypothetical protein
MQCRRVICKCVLPACSDSPLNNLSRKLNDPISCSTRKTAFFVTLNSAAHCRDETEVQCREGYVYFEQLADVRYYASIKHTFFADQIFHNWMFCHFLHFNH